MKITNDILYVGVNDRKIDLFEGQYKVPNGMCYNSYVILDGKIAVMDSVDQNFTHEWLAQLDRALDGRTPDFLVVSHMEPDHSANIVNFAKNYPNATIVSSEKAFSMMKNFFGTDFADRRIVVRDGDTLELGKHVLHFVFAPMVHWPEVMVTYESTEKVLFSADAFGKFGAMDAKEDWADEARRYYIGIVGKYGNQVQVLLKKAANLDIQKICPLHGPILTENLGYYLEGTSKNSSRTESAEVFPSFVTKILRRGMSVRQGRLSAVEKGGLLIKIEEIRRISTSVCLKSPQKRKNPLFSPFFGLHFLGSPSHSSLPRTSLTKGKKPSAPSYEDADGFRASRGKLPEH